MTTIFKNKHSRLAIHGLELNIHLGLHQPEREHRQVVALDVLLDFAQPPVACQTDNLADSYCYAKLAAEIREKTSAVRYHLIEHLTHEIYLLVKSTVKENAKVGVRITKQPSIPDLRDGVSFYYGDQE